MKEVTDDPMYAALHHFAIQYRGREHIDWGDAPIANKEKLFAASLVVARRCKGVPDIAGAKHGSK